MMLQVSVVIFVNRRLPLVPGGALLSHPEAEEEADNCSAGIWLPGGGGALVSPWACFEGPGKLVSRICVYDIHLVCIFLFVLTHRFNKYLSSICCGAGIILGSKDIAVPKITKAPYQGAYVFIIFTHETDIKSLLCVMKCIVWQGRQACNQINEVLQGLWEINTG